LLVKSNTIRKALITYFIGEILPVDIYVEISWVLDVLLIIVSALFGKLTEHERRCNLFYIFFFVTFTLRKNDL
jgi:hypothetical protein